MTDTKRKKRAPAKEKQAAPPHEPTEREIEQREILRARNLQRPDRPSSKIEMEGSVRVVRHADDQDPKLYSAAMLEAFGTTSMPFLNQTLDNIQRGTCQSVANFTEKQNDAAIAILAAVEPQNELEATLAAQMVIANEAAMRCMRSMIGAEWVPQHQMYGNLANKFMRTFTAQVEALAKLRRKGEQVVKHVHVHEGGQAVVDSTINQYRGGGVDGRSDGQPYGAGTAAECAALSGPDPARDGVPLPCHAEREMSPSWREVTGASTGEPECS